MFFILLKMSEKLKILFIVNPISGIGKQNNFQHIVETSINNDRFDWQIAHTKYAGNAKEIAADAVKQGYNIVTAVGGDGSINEVAGALAGSRTALAVIPCGSGNGFARHLGLSLKPSKAIRLLKDATFRRIDTAFVNDKFFLSVAGVGFDSTVAEKFAHLPGRGMTTYLKAVLSEYFSYSPKTYEITADGKTFTRDALLITLCNSSQYGYGFRIAPNAELNDGKLNLCIIHKPILPEIPLVIAQIMAGKANHSHCVEIIECENVEIKNNDCGMINLDGETVETGTIFNAGINKSSLKIFC